MNRAAAIIAVSLLAAQAAVASEPRLPPGVSCSIVKGYVKAYGRIAAYAWAKLNGYSNAEIMEAKKCLEH